MPERHHAAIHRSVFVTTVAFLVSMAPGVGRSAESTEDTTPDAAKVRLQWGVQVPMRDGVQLNATLYLPAGEQAPAPCIFTLTPYISESYHDRGVFFAAHGLPFATVDVRGRGNSDGTFRPMLQEARDGHDVVEWLAAQPWCNGKVAMWGGSYAGYNQWATAKELPPHLATIVPAAAVHPGLDFPMRNAVSYPYVAQWLMLTSGRASQGNLFGDQDYWSAINRRHFEAGKPFREFAAVAGSGADTFLEWTQHPFPDAYWDAYNPTLTQYQQIRIPVLTITGSHDGDQPGALAFYRQHVATSGDARERHFLIIGPWDHAGTRTPQAEFGGLKVGEASLLDLNRLHLDWYAWTMQGGAKPKFLEKPVAYYVLGAEQWRYADSLEAVTARSEPWYLDSKTNATSVFAAGALTPGVIGKGAADSYVYDPRDTSAAALEIKADVESLIDQSLVLAADGKQLVYHSAPFASATEISGFFKLSAWLAIDQPDTDFGASIYEIAPDGSSVLLTTDWLRARHRESQRAEKLISTTAPLRYDFERFTFISRQVRQGSRLRLVIAPLNSIHVQKNYNSGGPIAEQSLADARAVNVRLFHDRQRPSALYVPLGQPAK